LLEQRAAVLRAPSACGWFGIQTWIGGEAINVMVVASFPSCAIFPREFGFVSVFWLLHRNFNMRGIDNQVPPGIIRAVSAVIGVALLAWR